MLDILESAGLFIGFWLFIFSKEYRQIIIKDWHEATWFGKFTISIGAISSFFCGVILPAMIFKFMME